MDNPYENKVVKQKKLGKECTLKVSENKMAAKIFVEFASNDGRLLVQKSFQNTFMGKKDAKVFQNSIKGLADLKRYLRIK